MSARLLPCLLLPALLVLVAPGGPAAARPAFHAVSPSAGAAAGLQDRRDCSFELDGEARPAECWVLRVPENRDRPGSRLIGLPVIRIPAARSPAGLPVFWFEGGPGSPNLFGEPSDGLAETHDIVMVGYRGVDGEVSLDCPEVAAALRAAPRPILGEPALESYGRGAAACAARLGAEGVDLAGYTMTQTVDDMEAARQGFGYGPVALLGRSFGTRLELIYMWRHPEAVARAILVAANPPGHFIWDPAVTERLLAEYGRLCAADAGCAARGADLPALVRSVLAGLPERLWGIAIDADAVRLGGYLMMVESVPPPGPMPFHAAAGVDFWQDAAAGERAGVVLASVLMRQLVPGFAKSWGHLMAMGGNAADYTGGRLAFTAADGGTALGAPLSRMLAGLLRGWPGSGRSAPYDAMQPSAVETLVISGNLDFSTPVFQATEELLPMLARGRHVVVADSGHAGSFWSIQPVARATLLRGFLDDGRVDASGYVHQPIDFAVRPGLSGLAAWVLAAVAAAALVALAVLWLAGRWLRRRLVR